MKKILVVEDEATIREFVVINLRRSGYETCEAESGEEALEYFRQHSKEIDIALLDIMLPGIDGISVCRELRKQSDSLGIIMLSAKSQEMDKVSGLMMGADDYITKPFSPSELVARVDSLYRRVAAETYGRGRDYQKGTASGKFSLNLRNRTLSKGDELIDLTQVEFQIIEYFFENPGLALSRTSILNHVWGEGYYGEEKIVDVNIRRLRMKIEDDPSNPVHLVTVWGLGYKWEA